MAAKETVTTPEPNLGLPETQVVALGYSVVAALSDNAQITFHSAIADDDPDEIAHAKIDRIMRIVTRQRALAEVTGLEKELRDHEDAQAQVEEDMANAEINFQKAQADLGVQVETLRKSLAEANEEAKAQHAATGRGGSYAPRGHVKANIERAKSGLDAVLGAMVRNENEKTQNLSNLKVTMDRRAMRIDQIKARLAEINLLKG